MSNAYTFTGRVVHVGQVEQVGQKNTPKLSFVVSDEAEKYPQEVPFDCIGKSVDNVKRELVKGQQVTVSFDLRGRYWEKGDRWFSSLNAWRVESLGSKPAPQSDDPNQGDLPPLDSEDDLDSEIPF